MIRKIQDKAQIASTLTWIAAFILIFFILFLFLYASSALAVSKKASNFLGNLFSKDEGSFQSSSLKMVETRKIMTFLNIPFRDNKNMYSLLCSVDSDDEQKGEMQQFFISKGQEFIKDNFPEEDYSTALMLQYSSGDENLEGYVITNDDSDIQSSAISVPICNNKKLVFGVKPQ